jgi:hypothetical protein
MKRTSTFLERCREDFNIFGESVVIYGVSIVGRTSTFLDESNRWCDGVCVTSRQNCRII